VAVFLEKRRAIWRDCLERVVANDILATGAIFACSATGKAKLKSSILRAFVEPPLRAITPPPATSGWATEAPIRAELFSVERLEQHGESLAAAQRITPRRGIGRPLAKRLRDNGRVLLEAYRVIAEATREHDPITPAAEWLVDNFHVVEAQIREIKDDLPPAFYRQLPKLADGPFEGFPRVFGLAWAFVAHTDSRFDADMLCRFVHAYQRIQPLTIGELWAIAITLRIVLVENLRRLAERMVTRRAARREADSLADRLLGAGSLKAQSAETVLSRLSRAPLPTAFAVQLVQRLRDQDPKVMPALSWLDDRLTAQGTSAEEIVREEQQHQGASNVTVRNIITSMRLISAVDWPELFERVSLVDVTLRAGSDFAEMDFPTRDLYRRAIEELARGSPHSEIDVARLALRAARRAADALPCDGNTTEARQRDPGYYLIAKGRLAFERELGFRVPMKGWLARANRVVGIAGYLGIVAVMSTAVVILTLYCGAAPGSAWALGFLALVALIPASDIVLALVNYVAASRFGATILPGLELRGGVPPDLRTMIVIPTLLTTRAAIEEQIEHLEVHFLASSDGDLHFALLSDWIDSATEMAPDDAELLGAAVDGIARLNRRYGPSPNGERFLLLHRRRVWNEGQGKWIGWERKRGKLHELNRLLRGAVDTTFLTLGGHPPVVPSQVRYVITLDGDTRLPRGAAKRLIGKMAHPLNRPTLDPLAGRVREGHAVLQPRVTPSLPTGREGSLYQRVFSSAGGLDPYAFAVSDVYQDLFGEGSYSGKGIYDVDFFEAALEGRTPDNTLLSHDLFEGTFARAGLVSDVEVVEEFPSRYDVAAARQHRWARGDWQLLPWILGQGRSSKGDAGLAVLPLIGRWKMIDNLRRSLSAPAMILVLLCGWIMPFASAPVWSGFVLVAVALPALLPLLTGILPRRLGISKRSHVRAVAADIKLAFSQIALLVTFMAHQAWLMCDAIARTLFRLFVSHRMLLEWVTAAQAKIGPQLDLAGLYRQMAGGVAVAIGAALLVIWAKPGSWPIAAPFVVLWALSPAIARWASVPPAAAVHKPISAASARSLRLVARRTWRFFETFVTTEEHMLPPDNFQEEPKPVLAHRTSPTNIGVYLLSVIAARDFGWHGTLDTVRRVEATLETMNALDRFRGHFYNWYGTRDLRPLEPKYISSVDSGNLAGHLIALSNACRTIVSDPAIAPSWTAGIEDALALAREALRGLSDDGGAETVARTQLDDALDVLSASLQPPSATPSGIARQLAGLMLHADSVADLARVLVKERGDDNIDLLTWAEAVRASVQSHQRDLDLLMPWAGLIAHDSGRDVRATIVGNDSPEEALERFFDAVPSPADLPDCCEAALGALAVCRAEFAAGTSETEHALARTDALIGALEDSARSARSLVRRIAGLAELAQTMFTAMSFDFLLDPGRQLLSIGYRVDEGALDPSCYDLLASEARLASFVAIAKGDVPARHWFRLGRALTPVDRGSALISWSGSMFEYLMPSLVMRAPAGSVLEQTARLVVRRQIKYGAELGMPWGVSESAYNARDLELTYQYSNFGIPGLGLKRGLSENIVIAPYATALAAMIDPESAEQNLSRLTEAGGRGSYGWYEALDYTQSRLPVGEKVAVIRAYMAHHQGMTIIAILNALQDGIMRARFHAEPLIQATELLLQERPPRDVTVARPRVDEVNAAANVGDLVPPMLRRFQSPHDLVPRTHLLSNGDYAVMITSAGSGYSHWRGLAITRWREDVTCDSWGSYIFLRDARSGDVWSAGYQPSGAEPDRYEVTFSEDRAEIVRHDGTITTTLDVAVSPEDDAEVRRVSIANLGRHAREIELTSYAEIVLAPQSADTAHPAFSKLFVQTEFVAEVGTLLATRRRRSQGEPEIWAAHLAVVEGEALGDVQFETDRARFIGRGRAIRTPIAVVDGRKLSNTVGTVLDPIFSLRYRVRLPPGATVRVAFWTLIAPSRGEALDLADKHRDATAYDRAVTRAWTQAQVQLRHLGISTDEAHLFQRVANRVLYSDPTSRPSSDILKRITLGPSALWPQGISGDLPIVLLRIDEVEDVPIVRQLFRAQEYWRMKQLAVDLVILNERPPSYTRDLQAALETVARTNQSRPLPAGTGVRGAVFILRTDLLSLEARSALQTAARAVLLSRRGSLAEQIKRLPELKPVVAPLLQPVSVRRLPEPAPTLPDLRFFNGLGGFTADGREYVTILAAGQCTPAPWINVIANPSFGFQVSAEGGCYTWSVNSRENQLTPWSNDPVSDQPGEVLYLRDEDSGEVWGPTALPIRADGASYVIRHGQGYSRFEHASHGIALELLQFVPLDDPIKISRLRIQNNSGRSRRLSVTAYVEWVLGISRGATAPSVVTEIDSESGAMLARNPWRPEYGSRVAFIDLGGRQQAWTGDRTEFLGRNGTLGHPAALAHDAPLSNTTGAALDPCGVLQTHVELEPKAVTEIIFCLGEAGTKAETQSLIARYRTTDLDAVLATVTRHWDEVLDAVQIKTPDRAMDILVNRWLLYQTLVCRVWARSAFYQASGAFGFRDQLQDGTALAVSRPALTREHLLRAAARQFLQGDVQHWWLPQSGQGVRTRVSDDRLWLSYAVAHYVEVTGDLAVLDETVPFLEGPALQVGEHDSYFQPMISDERATLFEHCALALDQSLSLGSHGLPLIGTGDWNDGMNRVGEAGKGESIWLGWFLHATLSAFAPLAENRKEDTRAATWRQHAATLRSALEQEGWDGDWYRRGYFDDGTPLGSAASSECRIDSIAQSWGVISGAADPGRAARAMGAVDEYLVRRNDGLVLLFTPPFDQTPLEPGYIKGYPPGIRENGSQYTHAALWSVLAFAMLGDGDKATELFSIMNPINHASTPSGVHRYKVEPYVVCADVYAAPPHVGRGGWTWYTGSAGWMYRAGLEWILGFRVKGAALLLDPCVPKAWPRFEILFRYHAAQYVITVENPHGVNRGISHAELDGVTVAARPLRIELVDDGTTHRISVILG
jgi:cyclic beta-1,2-glucan synthetase